MTTTTLQPTTSQSPHLNNQRTNTGRRPKLSGRKLVCIATYFLVVALATVIMLKTIIPISKLSKQKLIQDSLQTELTELQETNIELNKKITNLGKPSSVQSLANEQYNLAYPGQEVFILLP